MSEPAVDVLRRKLARLLEIYGRNHAAICLTVVRYRARGALRDVGKSLVLPDDLITALASQVWGWSEGGGAKKSTPPN